MTAEQDHAPGLLALVNDALVQEGGDWQGPAAPHGEFAVSIEEIRALIAAPRSKTIVAVQGDTIVGSVLVTRQPNGRCALGLLGVNPDHRRRGLGGRLIDAAEIAADRDFGSDQIELCVLAERHKLAAYYARFGFSPTGEHRTVPLADATMQFMVMSKPIVKALAA